MLWGPANWRPFQCNQLQFGGSVCRVEPLQPSQTRSPLLSSPNPLIPRLRRTQAHFSAVSLETKFCPMSSVAGFPDADSHQGFSCCLRWCFTVRRVENSLVESLFWTHNTGPVALSAHQKIVVPTMGNGRGKETDLEHAAKPKHTLQAFLLQRDTQGKPSQHSASLKTHTWASGSLQQPPTEQTHAALARQPGEGKLEGFNKLLQIILNIISFSSVLYSYSLFLED